MVLRQGGVEDQLFLVSIAGDDREHATFDQVRDSLPIAKQQPGHTIAGSGLPK